MSSNIRLTRICQHCGKEFEARTTVTKTCSDHCAKRLYKAKKKAEKIEASNQETKAIITRPLEELKAKDYLTVPEVAQLLNSSRQTIHNLIKAGRLAAVKLSERKTMVRRSDIDKLFNPDQNESSKG